MSAARTFVYYVILDSKNCQLYLGIFEILIISLVYIKLSINIALYSQFNPAFITLLARIICF